MYRQIPAFQLPLIHVDRAFEVVEAHHRSRHRRVKVVLGWWSIDQQPDQRGLWPTLGDAL